MYVVISLAYRLGIAVLMAANLESPYDSTLYPIGVSFAFLLYYLTHLPYNSVLHNYRSTVIHSTSLVILITSNYYRSMQANMPLPRKAHLHGPGLLLYVCIVACILITIVCFLVELIRFLRNQCNKCRDKLSAGTIDSLGVEKVEGRQSDQALDSIFDGVQGKKRKKMKKSNDSKNIKLEHQMSSKR